MLTAITFTRAMVNWLYGGKNLKQLSIGIKRARSLTSMEFFKQNTKINFMRLRKVTAAISTVLFLASLICLGVKGLNWGLDFYWWDAGASVIFKNSELSRNSPCNYASQF